MKRASLTLALIALACGMLAIAASCRRSDMRTALIRVPGLSSQTAVRIATNAALDVVVGRYDGIQNHYEVDLDRKLVLYHESQRLLSRPYQQRIVARIAEVGFGARVVNARLNPPAPTPTVDGLVQEWPNRHTAVIHVPDMTSVLHANIVVDAIAYARLGRDDPRVDVRPGSGEIVASYQSLLLAQRNIEEALAAVGFSANGIPSKLGHEDALPHGWYPVLL